MPSDRARHRRGTSASIAGDVADEVLAGLVQQFSDPYAFVRELIQNSLDAASSRVEVRMSFVKDTLEIAVADDGEGMDQETIEGYLLTLFRSTKEKDLTKIGKFGIGFVSLFAIEPDDVVVDTGRDGVWHRVQFHLDRSYTLLRMPDPLEGTTVTLRLRRTRKKAQEDCERVRASAVRWCRFADADVTTSASGIPEPWPATPIRAPFTVDAPVVVEASGDGWRAVVGPSGSERPRVGFYNRGLTLWEADEAMIPGVTFRVHGRHLEHTLTRDNVIRDRHFEEVMARVREVAAGALAEAVRREAVAAASSGDLDRVRRLFAALGPRAPWSLPGDVPLLPAIGRPPATLDELRPRGLLQRWIAGGPEVWLGDPSDRLAREVAASGAVVLVAASPEDAHVAWLQREAGTAPAPVAPMFVHPVPADADAAVAAVVSAMADLVGQRLAGVVAARFAGGGDALRGRLAFLQDPPFATERAAAARPRAGHLLVDVDHPLWDELRRLPVALAAPIALRAAWVDAGLPRSSAPDLLAAALAGLP